jgi:hypothetical protein
MAKELTLEEVKAVLTTGNFSELIGLVENEWLECKAAPYQLQHEHQKQELGKDVSALANAGGGIILIGVRTEQDATHFGDEIVEIRPFDRALANPKQYQDVLTSRLYPSLWEVKIEWFESATEAPKGICAIIIPNQPPEQTPYLLRQTLDAGGKFTDFVFGYIERRRANADHLSVQELHALIREGRRVESINHRLENIEATLGDYIRQETKLSTEAELWNLLQERMSSALVETELSGKPAFSLGAIPMERVQVDDLFKSRDSEVVHLLEFPPSLRRGGFNLHADHTARIVRGQLRRNAIREDRSLELWRDGTLVATTSANEEGLCWAPNRNNTQTLKINPIAPIEYVYLFVQLSKLVLEKTNPQFETIGYRLELRNPDHVHRPIILTPGSLNSFEWRNERGVRVAPGQSFEATVKWEETPLQPEIIAFQLVCEVYRWFGIDDSDIPYKREIDGRFAIDVDAVKKL